MVVDTMPPRSGLSDHGVLEDPKFVDLDPHRRTGLQAAWWVHDETDTCRRPGGDDRAGQQREGRREVGDQFPAVGDHLLGRCVLTELTVDPGADAEVVRVTD